MNYTCKLPVSGSENISILNTEWTEQQVKLLLLHDNTAWDGKFQIAGNEEITELLDQLSMSEKKYYEETKSALTTHGGAANFAYSIENDKFIWKKIVRKNMSVKFGYVSISKVPVFDTFEKIIDNILQSLIGTSDKLATVDEKKLELEKENLQLKTKCDDLIEKKTEMESTLYSKFLCILNEKKKKIEELKQNLEPSDHLHDSDSYHSDNDHFDSETDIDSDEDTHSPTKLEVVKAKGCLGPEKKKTFILPKRSKQSGKQEYIMAGSSGINNQLAQNNSNKKVCPEKSKGSLVVGKSKRNTRCIIKTTVEDFGKSNSEDEFAFPKRSRNNKTSTNPAIVSKVNYDSDDETVIDTDIKQETNPNLTFNKIILPKMAAENTNLGHEEKKIESNEKSDTRNKNNYQGFSSSTLDILNNLA